MRRIQLGDIHRANLLNETRRIGRPGNHAIELRRHGACAGSQANVIGEQLWKNINDTTTIALDDLPKLLEEMQALRQKGEAAKRQQQQ